ncbi:unnamed protein product [marine sediment metagenome]|uniref:Uncharacterized protein n=1 Tax=marine sediment metagenome TaxID=412755 RepID=X1GX85_9ZZZZ
MTGPLISRVIKAGNFLFLSGLTGDGPDTETQSRDIFEKMKKILEDSDSSMENIINATVYLTDLNDRPKHFNPVWSEYFTENPPTRTCIQVGLAHPAKVEVTVVAIISKK